MSGLFLVGEVRRIDPSRVVTASATGVSDGRLSRLRLIRSSRLQYDRVEESDVDPHGEVTWLGYDLSDVADGFYSAESTNDERVTYFEVSGGGVGWFGHDEKEVMRRMRRA